ncbi:MAG: hypothetical protein ACMG6E_04990, partial [Candidatus Roizmanbacteria bacterium]
MFLGGLLFGGGPGSCFFADGCHVDCVFDWFKNRKIINFLIWRELFILFIIQSRPLKLHYLRYIMGFWGFG